MGRKKVEIKRIENKSSRQVTFSKRRNGLIEKARQLSILCESSVAVLVVSGSGKLYNSSSGDNMSKIIDRYDIHQADELKASELAEATRNYLPHKELLEIVQSKLEEPNVDNVSVDSLISLEEQLETALSVTRARKTEGMMEYLKSLQEKDRLLREENQILVSQMEKNPFLATEDEEKNHAEESKTLNPIRTFRQDDKHTNSDIVYEVLNQALSFKVKNSAVGDGDYLSSVKNRRAF